MKLKKMLSTVISAVLTLTLISVSGLTIDADYINVTSSRDAANYIGANQIKFRFADKSEGIALRLGNEDYFNNLSQQDLNYRLQKNNATLEEYKEFSKAQILDFTDEQKKMITDIVDDIQEQINDKGYNLPLNDEIIFVNTTAEDECGASGYTQGNQIYLSNVIVSDGFDGMLTRVICHEIFHCITRSNPQFREDMYKIIGFSIAEEEPEFPQEIKEFLISNPDVEKNDSYATFTINGKKRDCYMVWYFNKPFENEGDSFFQWGLTALIPTDDLSTIYTMYDASDFWKVVGKNTLYVTSAEECLADNFTLAVLFGSNGKESPEIIDSIIKYLKTANLRGDISGNGTIDLYDAIEISKYFMGMRTLTDEEKKIADYNGDGKVDLYDAIGVAVYIMKNK